MILFMIKQCMELGWSLLFNRGTNDYALAAYNNFFNCANNNLLPMNSYYDVLAGLAISGVLALRKNFSNTYY